MSKNVIVVPTYNEMGNIEITLKNEILKLSKIDVSSLIKRR